MANCITFVTSCILIVGFINMSQSQPVTPETNVITFGVVRNGTFDNRLAFKHAWDVACASTGNLKIPVGNFLVGPINFSGPCKAKTMVINVIGTITAIAIKEWNTGDDTWLNFENVENLVINGTTTGQFDVKGDSGWWNCEKTNTSCEKNPTALGFHHCNGVQLIGVTSKNSPRNHISINGCNGAKIEHITLIAPEESPNTDGIDISATNVVNVNGGSITTGDDCIAINGGSDNIHVDGLFCGPGHGVSVGSLGRNGNKDIVRNVTVINTTFNGTQNGVRLKTVPGGSGFADGITFGNITMVAVENPIILTQFYCPRVGCIDINPVVHVSGVTFKDIHGTSSKPGAITITCSKFPNSCTGITLDNINIKADKPPLEVVSVCHNTQVQIIGVVFPPVVCTPASFISMALDHDLDAVTQKQPSKDVI